MGCERAAGVTASTVDQMLPEQHAARIRALRAKLGCSQPELAERLGVSKLSVGRWERGEAHPSPLAWQRFLALEAEVGKRPLGSAVSEIAFARSGALSAVDLPVPLTSFIGREAELASIEALLASTRLLTVAGAGGSGKTRLALELGRRLVAADRCAALLNGAPERHAPARSFPDGVWLADLGPLTEPAAVAPLLASLFHVQERPGRSLLETLAEFVSTRHLLLLLDNCEHLLDTGADLAQLLLQSAPGLQILATSREPLGLPGELVWRAPPLSLPAGDDLARSDAARLFLTRARERDPHLVLSDSGREVVARICRRLDGLPLTLELAAAWVGVLSVEQILAGLDDALMLLVRGSRSAPARQRTLRATLDWSYTLLAPAEQRLLQRLAVFAGSFDLVAVEAIAGCDRSALLPVLARLVEASLVTAEEGTADRRYRLLETVRAYARERLQASGDLAETLRRHAQHYHAFAEDAEARLTSADQSFWLRQLQDDYDNLRAALAWTLSDEGDIRLGLRLGGALGRFWNLRGYWSEGLRWLEELLARRRIGGTARAKALNAAAWLSLQQGWLEQAETCASEAQALLAETDGPQERALALHTLASVAGARGDFAGARSLFEVEIALWQSADAPAGVANALNSLGITYLTAGDYERAREIWERCLALQHHVAVPVAIVTTMVNLGTVAMFAGDVAAARRWFEQSLPRARELSNTYLVAHCVHNLGAIALVEGDVAAARVLLEESLALVRALGWTAGVAITLDRLARAESREEQFERARDLLAESLRLRRGQGVRTELAEGLLSCAMLAAESGDAERAARLYGVVEALETGMPVVPRPIYARDREVALAVARSALGERRFTALREEGKALSGAEALAYALGESPPPPLDESASVAAASPTTWTPPGLSAREAAVLRLLAEGKSNRAIAAELIVSVRTVEHHLTSLYAKIGVSNRVEAVVALLRRERLSD